MEISLTKRYALAFIVLLGIVSLFSDMTYEGARSINGAYLAILGANAAVVGFVAGFGEFIGFGLRFISGYFTERTQRYWLITIIGYAVNLFAVPLLAIAHHWWAAACFIVLERFGKAIRVPARDAMLAHASQNVGMGWGFGLHQALDQTGAMLGPLLVAAMLYYQGNNYRAGFVILLIPALLALTTLSIAYRRYPNPHQLAVKKLSVDFHIQQHAFKYFLIGAAFVAAGYADFPLMAYHFEKTNLLQPLWIPVTYGLAMGIGALTAPLLGRLYDRFGLWILMSAIVATAWFAPFVFWGNKQLAWLGVGLWAVGMGVQDSLLRSIVGNLIPAPKRPSAYGLFNLIYGACWFIGSVLLGLLYDHSLKILVYVSLALQFASLPCFLISAKKLLG